MCGVQAPVDLNSDKAGNFATGEVPTQHELISVFYQVILVNIQPQMSRRDQRKKSKKTTASSDSAPVKYNDGEKTDHCGGCPIP